MVALSPYSVRKHLSLKSELTDSFASQFALGVPCLCLLGWSPQLLEVNIDYRDSKSGPQGFVVNVLTMVSSSQPIIPYF